MYALWIAIALASAAAAGLILGRAALATRAAGAEDPALAVYRRQIDEIDDLADRGLLAEPERRSAKTEAQRRLLSAGDRAQPGLAPTPGARKAVVIVAALAPLAAAGLYFLIGSPQTPDQPFAQRLAQWRASDPQSLTPEEMVALLQVAVQEHPTDSKAWYFLSEAQRASGDNAGAIDSLRRAVALAPDQADVWTSLGDAYVAEAGGQVSDNAVAAFRHALQIDPTAPAPRFFLAQAQIAGGDVAGGLAAWAALDARMPANDPRKTALEQEMAIVRRTGVLPQGQAQPGAPDQNQQSFIRSMVDTLAARLKADPNDPAGWARLIRSYAVLGDAADERAALAKARTLFKDRPGDLSRIESAAGAPQ